MDLGIYTTRVTVVPLRTPVITKICCCILYNTASQKNMLNSSLRQLLTDLCAAYTVVRCLAGCLSVTDGVWQDGG